MARNPRSRRPSDFNRSFTEDDRSEFSSILRRPTEMAETMAVESPPLFTLRTVILALSLFSLGSGIGIITRGTIDKGQLGAANTIIASQQAAMNNVAAIAEKIKSGLATQNTLAINDSCPGGPLPEQSCRRNSGNQYFNVG
jgi:hypothetical protein